MSKVTKKEFYKNIARVQKQELNTDRFRFVKNFIDKYSHRDSFSKEQYLFDLIRDCKSLVSSNISSSQLKEAGIIKYNELSEFISSFSVEDINNNFYLKIANYIFKTCDDECESIIRRSSLDKIEELPVPESRLDILQSQINLQTKIPYYKPNVYEMESVNILDEDNLYYYDIYNIVIKNVRNIYELVYFLKINKIINDKNLDIYIKHFYARLNDGKKVYSLRLTR